MDSHTGGDAVVDVLLAAGVEVIFGIPSVHNLPIYDSIRRRGGIRAITVRHEQGAAGAADAYARTSGKLGVFITSTGPGAANAMGGLLEAFVSGSPVLHLTGQIETKYLDQNRGFIHEVPDQPAMLGSLSKSNHRADSADSMALTVAAAISEALSAPPGPVSVELPIDLQYAQAVPVAEGDLRRAAEPAVVLPVEAEVIDELATIVAASRRPLVWAGGGVVSCGAAGEVASLCRLIGAGLITSPNGRGVLDEDDAACIGNLAWDSGVRDLLAEADLLVAIGTRFQGPNTENWRMVVPSTLVIIDVEPERSSGNYPPRLAVSGDAKAVLTSLLASLGSMTGADSLAPRSEDGWLQRVAAAAAGARTRLRTVIGAQEALLDATTQAISPATTVVKDATIPAYTWGNRLLPVRAPRRAVMPNGFAIGLGLPHAVGAAAASVVSGSGEPVVLMAGDGGFMLAATELATAAAEQLPIVVLIFADGGYGILRNIQDKQYGAGEGRIGVELPQPDFVGLARALGVKGERVSTVDAYASALGAALQARQPYLIEVDVEAIGPMSQPYTGTSRPPEGATKAG